MARLQAHGVWAGYGGPPVLVGIDLDLGPGERVGLIGRSGAGKSTLVEVLAGIGEPSRGSVTLDGLRVHKPARRDRKSLAARLRVVHQNGHRAANLEHTVDRAVRLALAAARAAGRSTGLDAEQVLSPVELPTSLLARRVLTLSGGERQRLALALALATRPDVLLLDEPLTALDPTMRHHIAARLADRADTDGMGLLIASHDVRLVEQLTTTVHVLADGQLVEHGPLGRVLADPQHPDTRDFVAALPSATLRWS